MPVVRTDPPGPTSQSTPEGAVAIALEAWSHFTSLGSQAVLDRAFVIGGPQFEQLASELPIGEPPVAFFLKETMVRSRAAASATVWASVWIERTGYRTEVHDWDFDLVRIDGVWRVWTVVTAERPDEGEWSSTTPTSTGAIREMLTQVRERSSLAIAVPSNDTTGIRLPALSAWIIVITIAGVALAGYLAPRIDRRRER